MKRLAKVVLSASLVFPALFGMSQTTEASANDNIVNYSKKLVGTPYVYGGTTTNGFDCSGFIRYVYSHYDVDLPRISRDQYGTGTPVAKADLQIGDAVFFNTSGSGVSHAGIYIGNNQFIHSATSSGVKVSSLSERYWSPRYVGAKRYKDLGTTPPPPDLNDGKFMGIDIRSGQIGVIEVKKPINLWKRDSENKLEMVRILNPGEKYRVYTYDQNYGGQYGLGGTFITNMEGYIEYHELNK
jgi:hypothetical protein